MTPPMPSRKLVLNWVASWYRYQGKEVFLDLNNHIAKQASRWGYEQAVTHFKNEHNR